jgi:hypothetical protein
MKKNSCLFLSFVFLIACQSTNVENTVEPTLIDDYCINTFEPINNQEIHAPEVDFSEQSDWLFLSKKDVDYWKTSVKMDKKGKIPSKMLLQIGGVCTTRLSIIRTNNGIVRPFTFMTFRSYTSTKIDIDNPEIGEIITVLLEHVAGESTCYNLTLIP